MKRMKLGRATYSGAQYSVLRVGTGLLAGAFLLRASVVLGADSAALRGVCILGLAATLPFVLGWRDRAAGLLLGFSVYGAGGGALWGLAFSHIVAPPAPYGSLASRGRVDPGGGWERPPLALSTAWFGLFLMASTSANCTGILALDEALYRAFAFAGQGLFVVLILAAWILGFLPRVRAWLWWTLAVLFTVGLFHHGGPLGQLPLLVFFAWTFEPAWIPPRGDAAPETLFFDGGCGLCHGFVRFVLAEDSGPAFHFAPLESDLFRADFSPEEREGLPDSIVVRTSAGELLTRSSAAAHILQRLGGAWRLVGFLLVLIPRPLRDFGYDAVARVRHRIFKRPKDACPMFPPHLGERFRY